MDKKNISHIWVRTIDIAINSRTLCQLSYTGSNLATLEKVFGFLQRFVSTIMAERLRRWS
jgi:hypothetical protein